MKKNFIIQAHQSPEQLQRLIDSIYESNSSYYIHIDLKSDVEAFKQGIRHEHVHFITNRLNCIWGDFSQVEATLNLIGEVLKHNQKGPVIFLSGQDYPIKSKAEINRFLEQNKNFDFIRFDDYTECITREDGHFYDRLTHYKINLSDKRGDFMMLPPFGKCSFKQKIKYFKLLKAGIIGFGELFSTFNKPRTAEFCGDTHFRGPNWWAISWDNIKAIYDYYLANKTTLDLYYKYTFCADEQFFHTIYKCLFKSKDIKDYLHYVDWDREGVPLPVTFGHLDYDVLVSQPEDKIFARKFDAGYDAEILDLLDKQIRP